MKLAAATAVAAIAFLTPLLATGCGGTTTQVSDVTTGPDIVRCQTSVAPPGTVPYAGSRLNLTVVAERECTWNARSETDWARVEPASGQGQANIVVNVSENPASTARSATIVVNDTRLSLTQEAAPCSFRLGSTSSQISFEGGRISVSVTTPGGCAWRASSSAQSWARVAVDSGTGSGTVEIEVSPNTGGERSATVTIADQPFTVIQAARPPELPPPGGSGGAGCTVTLDANERSFGANGGEGSIRVTAPDGCAWTAIPSASWIEMSVASGTGTGDVRYRVGGNSATSARTGTITVSNRVYTVRQDGAPSGGGGGGEERVELSGLVLLVDGSCPNISFLLELRRVFTDSETRFRGGSCADVRPITNLRVEGRVQSDGRVRATEVRLRSGD